MDEAAKSRASLQESLSSRTVAVAKTAGFCFGVERAVDRVYEQIRAEPLKALFTPTDRSSTMSR